MPHQELLAGKLVSIILPHYLKLKILKFLIYQGIIDWSLCDSRHIVLAKFWRK